jgi:hypothetical protein
MTIPVICYILAFICFVIAAVRPYAWAIPVGLAFLTLGHVLAGVSLKGVPEDPGWGGFGLAA